MKASRYSASLNAVYPQTSSLISLHFQKKRDKHASSRTNPLPLGPLSLGLESYSLFRPSRDPLHSLRTTYHPAASRHRCFGRKLSTNPNPLPGTGYLLRFPPHPRKARGAILLKQVQAHQRHRPQGPRPRKASRKMDRCCCL